MRILHLLISSLLLMWILVAVGQEPQLRSLDLPCVDQWSGDGRQMGKLFWDDRAFLNVRFLDEVPDGLREAIIDKARIWEDHAGIEFRFNNRTNAEIRIKLDPGAHWSMIGTEALQVSDLNKPTMNLGLFEGAPDDYVQRVVLHEFGHALGLMHEHFVSEDNPIHWNEEAVYAYYRNQLGWSRNQTEANVLKRYNAWERWRKGIDQVAFDSKSIMLYPVPASLTTDAKRIELNTELSEGDIEFIQKHYPRF